MIAAVWLILSGLLYSLQLQTGSFPKPLTREEAGLGRKAFARKMNIPIRSLQGWESGRKAISRKSWEKYFWSWAQKMY